MEVGKLQGVLSNQLIITRKQFNKRHIEQVIHTYIEDEYLIDSAVLMLVSVLSFYPIIYLFNKQPAGSKMGRRYFDQMMIFAIMAFTFAHFLSEQKCFQAYSFIPLSNWHKLINILLLLE
mmetsp:Transcript_14725/g.25055  ORF Transcript_14725/g.25055 Transcript_14725/m.25055 type:complete len:120 (-) Transcript_14725:786-1145(-)